MHYEECDQCNARFSSTLEDALDKYTSVFRTLNNIKNKINKITSQDQTFKFNFSDTKNVFKIHQGKDGNHINFDKNGNFNITFDIKKYRPSDVYKAFMKIFKVYYHLYIVKSSNT